MARWDPGAKQRLQMAALQLYVRQGFEQTTVEEIARSVGLTERTFFRHFADKREVLFELDSAMQRFSRDVPDNPAVVQLNGVYYNLLRMWSEV